MITARRRNPIFLCRQMELIADILAVRPGTLPERLADLRLTLDAISPADFPTDDLAHEWAAIQSALPRMDQASSVSPEQVACEIACALLDLRTRLRQWVADRQSALENTAA
jgi:hypothetical protein